MSALEDDIAVLNTKILSLENQIASLNSWINCQSQCNTLQANGPFYRSTRISNFLEHLSQWVLSANPNSGHETRFALFAICCKLGRRTEAFNLYQDVIK